MPDNFITEEQLEQLESEGKIAVVENPKPVIPSEILSQAANQTSPDQRFISGSIAPALQYSPDLLATQYPNSAPTVRVMPVAPSGLPATNAAIQSTVANTTTKTVAAAAGVLSMPNIFSVGGAAPVTSPSAGTIAVTLVPEDAGTVFAGPKISTGLPAQVDKSTSSTGNSTSITTGSLTASQTNEWSFWIAGAFSYSLMTPGTGWNLLLGEDVAGNGLYILDQLFSTPTISGSATIASSSPYATAIANFFTDGNAPVKVQQASAGWSSPTTGSVTFSNPVSAGNVILFCVFGYAGLGAPTPTGAAASDSLGNNYSYINSALETTVSSSTYVYLFFADNIVGGSDTVSFSYNSLSPDDAAGVLVAIEYTPTIVIPTAVPTFRNLVNTDLDDAVFGPSGSSHNIGAVPDPGPVAGSTRVLCENATWIQAGGSVTSVAMTVPSILSVSGSPITTSGTLAVTLQTETANTVFAGPTSGSAATPTFRALGASDIPATIGLGNVKTGDYNIASADNGDLLILNSSSAHTFTLLGTAPATPWFIFVKNKGTGVLTIGRNGLTIDGASSNLTLAQGDGCIVASDGSNYWTGQPRPASVAVFAPGVGTNNQVLLYLTFDRVTTFPASAPNSYANAITAATGSTTYTCKKNGSNFATIVFSASGTTGAFTQASDATFSAGDILEIVGPAVADATLANVGITFQGFRF